MKHRICATIAETNALEALKLASIGQKMGADLIEYRLDFLERKNFEKDVSVIGNLKEQAELPVIFTVRSNKEGGVWEGSEEERLNIIEACIDTAPAYVDIELTLDIEDISRLCLMAKKNDVSVILSRHYGNMPPLKQLISDLKEAKALEADVVKIIPTAKTLEDNLEILMLHSSAKDIGIKIIAFCMGKYGVLSRILCSFFGSEFTYAGVNKVVASGQLMVDSLRMILDGLSQIVESE